MPMELVQHEEHLNAILDTLTDGEQIASVTEHLEALRLDYGTTVQDFTELDTSKTKLQTERDALIISNSQYFRDRSQVPPEQQQANVKPNTAITLESLGI